MTVVCTQIVGILARRIVCRSKVGDKLQIGEKYGLIKFGSRTDLLMPKNVEIAVKVGDRVVGGETIIGRLNCAVNIIKNGDDTLAKICFVKAEVDWQFGRVYLSTNLILFL